MIVPRQAVKQETAVYHAHEFASRAGVTVRALHHYDRLGLLKPSGRTGSGYRLYTDRDLVRLEQIVVLKFLGLPLKQIRDLLDRDVALAATLRRQQAVLADKRRQLDAAIHAIQEAERSLGPGCEPDWELFKRIITEVEMQDNTEWAKKYYSPEAQAKVEERKQLWSPELQARVSRQWSELVADVEAALGEDPAGTTAQALAARWRSLVEGFTGGDREIQKDLNTMWADKANWPAETQAAQFQIRPEVQTFITTAMQATKT
jgi:MerR family transcriptional regulator, thiopeptide resistance regulator